MQLPPLAFTDISLLLVVDTILFLLIYEFVKSFYGKSKLMLNKTRLKYAGVTLGLLFVATVAIKIIGLFTYP